MKSSSKKTFISDNFVISFLITLFSLLLRWLISLGKYSGFGKPPMFGDYEAQRHWMEITTHTPIGDWYRNTTTNDLLYWGLDYPPLSYLLKIINSIDINILNIYTAFISYIYGLVCLHFDPKMIELITSHGYESVESKLLMRLTVIISDILFYLPFCFIFINKTKKNENTFDKYLNYLILSIFPSLLLIDHGHFQYNSISLGLAFTSIICYNYDYDIIGSISYCCSIMFKQISLYYSPIFFFYILIKTKKQKSPLFYLIKIGITVILTFLIHFLPFCIYHSNDETCISSILHVIHRMFPWDRGLYEDKVSNIWCAISVIIKLKYYLSPQNLKMLCSLTTLMFLIPYIYLLHKKFNHTNFIRCLFGSSLSFFLCSYQVHEKSILYSNIPNLLLFIQHPYFTLYYNLWTSNSMISLLLKDNQLLSYIAMNMIWLVIIIVYGEIHYTKTPILYSLSIFVYIVIYTVFYFVEPPKKYPDLFILVNSCYSCLLFGISYLMELYFMIKEVKIKED